ncbi:MAG: DUF2628 domain-containing protein [Beijerinckiaceae bacterium]
MAVYTVHIDGTEPQLSHSIERMVLTPDGFSRWAFFLGPVWLLARGLWLALAIWLAAATALIMMTVLLKLPPSVLLLSYLAQGIFLGLEAGSLRARKLERKGLALVDIASGFDREDAERRFLSRWIPTSPVSRQLEPARTSASAGAASATIGNLFSDGDAP